MDTQFQDMIEDKEAVPKIVITKPSRLPPANSIVSATEDIVPITTDTPSASSNPTTSAVPLDQPLATERTTPVPEHERNNSSGEFKTAEECAECVVSLPEAESQSVDATTATSEADNDDFRTVSSTECCSIVSACTACLGGYERIWEKINSNYALPFWFALMAIPLSAGVMGSLYMYSCPGGDTLPSAVFSVGVSLMSVLTIRFCLILSRNVCENGQEMRQALQTLSLIATFLSAIFFATESVLFWKMDSTSTVGDAKFCDPAFVTYLFYWNCIMWFVMVPLALFPA